MQKRKRDLDLDRIQKRKRELDLIQKRTQKRKREQEKKQSETYYLARMTAADFLKVRTRAKVYIYRPCQCCYDIPERINSFTKEEILRFPKYLRRGFEYGHNCP